MQLKVGVLKWLRVFCLSCIAYGAIANADVPPKVVIVLTHLGAQLPIGLAVANLAAPATCAILPHQAYSAQLAAACHAQQKTVLLDLPMEADPPQQLGQGGLYAAMPRATFVKTFTAALKSVPYAEGVTNYLGDLLTTQITSMRWLLQTLHAHHLFFLDNKTAVLSVARILAHDQHVPLLTRDVFLDSTTLAGLDQQFNAALKLAKQRGVVIIVARACPNTLHYLPAALTRARAQGYDLVTAAALLYEKASVAPIAPVTAVSVANAAPLATAAVIQAKSTQPANSGVQAVVPPAPAKCAAAAPTADTNATLDKPINLPALDSTLVPQAIEVTIDKNRQVNLKIIETPAATSTHTVSQVQGQATTQSVTAAPSVWSRIKLKVEQFKQPRSAPAPAILTEPVAMVSSPLLNSTNTIDTLLLPTELAFLRKTVTATSRLTPVITSAMINYDALAANKSGLAFAAARGKLAWPVSGKIATRFGAVLGVNNLKYNGVLLRAPIGMAVHAIYGGRVIFANWLQGLGLLIIIDHGAGYMSLYGHNAALYKKAGDVVREHELIATVGNSGMPASHVPGLYFEIRSQGQPLDPALWCHA